MVIFDSEDASLGFVEFEGCEDVELVAEFNRSVLWVVCKEHVPSPHESRRGRCQCAFYHCLGPAEILRYLFMDYFASVRIYLEFVPLLGLSREVDLPLVVALVDNGSSHEILAN